MSTHTATSGTGSELGGMDRISVGLWIALGAAVLQFTALGSDFYEVGENVRDAWFGIPHASDLILLSALTTVVLLGLAAAGRSPVGGRTLGVIVGVVGLVAAAHLAYRMAVPPFKGCLTYNCGFSPKTEVTLLPGIWIGLIGNVGAALGGFIHAASGAAKRTRPNFWVSARQTGMTPWLGIAGLSAALMFVVGFTFMPFYTVPTEGGSKSWTAWLSIPHTSSLVLLLAAIVVGLVIAAGRGRAPMSPKAVGMTIAVLGFVAGVRTLYRIFVSPFYSGPAANAGFLEGVQVHTIAYVALGFAILTIVAGLVHASQSSGTRTARATEPVTSEPSS